MEINKNQEDIIKKSFKDVEKMWKEVITSDTLEEVLGSMTKDELIAIGKKYFVKGLTSLKKSDVIDRIKATILSSFNSSLEVMDYKVLKFLQDLLMSNGKKEYENEDILYLSYLRKRGLTFSGNLDGNVIILIPEELKALLKEAITDEVVKKSKLNTEVIKVIGGMTYYYGVIGEDFVLESLNNMFEEKFTKDKVSLLISTAEELGYDYILEDSLLCNIDVEDKEQIIALQNEKEINYCKYDKKTLVKAGEKDFIEDNKKGEKLKKFFAELFVIDKKILKEEMDEFIIAIKNEMDKDEAIDIFLEAYQIDNDEERNIFVEELNSFANSIKRWSFKGYSEEEFNNNAKRVVNTVTIGRNDPCTCGSGKKYKKCCGK